MVYIRLHLLRLAIFLLGADTFKGFKYLMLFSVCLGAGITCREFWHATAETLALLVNDQV